MGTHARTRRAPAARAAIAATLVAVAVSVLVGVGSAQEAPAAPVAGPLAAPLVPVVAPAVAPAPRVTPTPTAAPAAEEAAPVEDTGSANSGSAAQAREETVAPRSVPVRAEPARPAPTALVGGTPCTMTARACVDLVGHNAWLIDAGAVVRGPVPIMVGDLDDPTPRGTFRVQWKAEQYTSREFLTQMPYAVFFADGGVAFHEGRQDTNSRGCVKLNNEDAVAWFNYLQIDDEVQIR